MRRIALFLLLASGCRGQQATFISSNTLSNTQACAFSQNVTSGNVLIVAADTFGTLTGISDTLSSSWTLVASNTAQSLITRVWVATAASSGADTATVTGTNSSNGINCTEIPASVWTKTVDVSNDGVNTGYSGTPASFTTTNLTTTIDNDFMYCYASGFQNAGHLQPTSGTLFLGANAGTDSRAAGYKITGTNGTQNCTFNNVTNTKGNYVEITLKPVSGITVTTSALPTASTTHAYSYGVQAVGGTGAYTYSISAGSLPTGLSINSSTGVISGTPTAGTQTFTVSVTDGTLTGTQSLTLTVNSSASTPAFVQNSSGAAGTSGNVTATSGNINVVYAHLLGTTMKVGTPTDTLGTVYTQCGTSGAPTNSFGMAIYIGTLPSTGTNHVITKSVSGINVDEFSGAQHFCDIVVSTSGHSSASATLTSGSITTVAPNSMISITANGFTTNTTLAAQSPFTTDGSGINTSATTMLGEYNLESSVSSYTPTFTQASNTDGNWNMIGIVLQPGTSGSVASSVRHKVTQD